MKFIIDTDELAKDELGISGCFYLLSMYFKDTINSKTYTRLSNMGFTFINSFENTEPVDIEVTPNGMQYAEKLITAVNIIEKTDKGEDRYTELAKKIRELYPKGKKPGTNYQWRDSVELIATRLKTLVMKYKVTFTDEEVIEATRNYVSGFDGNYKYMVLLKYFIFKNTNDGVCVNQNSPLLSAIAELREGGETTSSVNWTSELR